MSPDIATSGPGFLAGGGCMGTLMRAHPWAETPLGSPHTWPQTLRTAVRLMLTSRHPMFIWWGQELTCLYNDAYSAATGPDRHPSALGRPGREVWAEIWDTIGPDIEHVMDGRGATWHERQLVPITRGTSRQNVWWTYGYSPIDDDAAATGVGGVLVVCRDVTAEVEAEQKALGEAEQLRKLFEQAPGFMAMLRGPDHVFELTNTAYNQLVNRYVLGKPVREALPEVEGQGFFELLDEVYSTGTAFTARRRLVTLNSDADPSLDRRFVDFVYQPVRDVSGNVAGIFVEGSDVTEATLADEALRASERRLRTLVEGIPQLVWRAASPGQWTWVSPQWTAYTGLSLEASLGEGWLEALHPADRLVAFAAWQDAVSNGLLEVDYRIRHVDSGYYCWYQTRGTPVRDEVGVITEWVGTCTDINDQMQARDVLARSGEELERLVAERTDALRQSEKLKAIGQLTGGIAHDFNNMLQSVTAGLGMIRNRVQQGRASDVLSYVERAETGARRAAALTHRLLAFARQQTLTLEAVSLDKIVRGMEDMVRRTVGPSVQVELKLADGKWLVLCDPNEMESALLNLCINARDAMPDGGWLTISTAENSLSVADLRDADAQPGRYVTLAVTDTGTGIPPEALAHVFEPFFTTKPLGAGTGLGLSQIYGFVRQSSGVVQIDTEPGNGTTVRLCLPFHEHNPDVDAALPPDTGKTILLVEDEQDVRDMTAEHLRELGYRVLEAESGGAALRILQAGTQLDLLVSDIGLPGGMNGRQVADAVRLRHPGLPVTLMTGYAAPELTTNMKVLRKPFEAVELTELVRANLELAANDDLA